MLRHLRAKVRAFVADERSAHGMTVHCDSWMSAPSARFSRALAAKGWIGMTWPVRYGGGERSEQERLVVIEELLAAGAPIAAHWFADRQVGPALLKHGTEVQRTRYLPAITRGECFFAIGLSEPDSGSDLASVRTTGSRTATGWRLSGRKVWTSHAHFAHHMLALVRTTPRQDGDRHAGLSQFLVDLASPGVQVRAIPSLDGQTHFNEVILDDVDVPTDALLGEEGAGWQQVNAELAYERSGPERFLSTVPLLFELVRRRRPVADPEIGRLLAQLQTLRTLSGQVAAALQRGETPTNLAALVKDLGTRFEGTVVDIARRLEPTEPDLDASDEFSRLLAEAVLHGPDATLRGGTNEILRGIVARNLAVR
jgi:alkylation response protein AidB-like acyl-CoA dehydrogenase